MADDDGVGEIFSSVDKEASLDYEEEVALLIRHKNKRMKRSRKVAIFVLGVLGAVLCLSLLVAVAVAVPVTLLQFGTEPSGSSLRKFSLDDVFDGNLSPRLFSGKWYEVGGTDILATVTHSRDLVAIFPHNSSNVTLVASEIMNNLSVSDFHVSPSLKYVLLKGPSTPVYRHSTLAHYYVYNIESMTHSEITVMNQASKLQFVHWSPTNDQLVFAVNYSLYYINDVSSMNEVPVEEMGERDVNQYGVPDWVYEEEMLYTDHAVWWSPGGSSLLYVQFDDLRVPRFRFPIYGPEDNVYTDIDAIAYPKSGQRNPNITVYASNVTSMIKHILLPPDSLSEDHYLQIGGWLNETHLYLVWLNRAQNERIFTMYDISGGSSMENRPVKQVKESVKMGWIVTDNVPTVVGGSGKLLQIMSQETGNNDGYLHLAEIDLENESRRFLTSGNWEVTEIIGCRGDTSDVLYISTESNVWERNIYSSKAGLLEPCLSCVFADWGKDRGVPSTMATRCTVFDMDCSKSLTYCVLHCRGPAVPYSILVKYGDGTELEESTYLMTLESNEVLIDSIRDIHLPKEKQIFTVPANEANGEPELYGNILFPPGFDSSKKDHYPVLVSVYGGPGSETILMTNIFYNKWALYQSASMDCIVVSVDGRGTGFRGDNFKFSVYRHLGELETEDQVRAGKYLSQLTYVDGKRLAIYGTSYGGYMAGMVGSSGSGVFNVAISRSPVTDWRYYDSIYTERYMGSPEDNLQEYLKSSLLSRASMFRDVKLLLIHGTGDDNVHFQNSAQLVKALTNSGIQFRLQFYTDKTHSISGLHARWHLYTLIDTFLHEHL